MGIKAVRGFKDILPGEAVWWRKVEAAAREVLDRFGYQEVRVPVVERTELFARSIGQDTDIVEKEMFSFPDRHGESLTLRPEATAGVVRALIEHNLAADGRPLKFYLMGPMFRYERPQKGRQRQFHQLNVEVFGVAEPLIDAELIVLLDHFLGSVGLTGVEIHLNSLGCPVCRPAYRERLAAFLHDRLGALCADCQHRAETNPLRVLDCKVPGCIQAVTDAPRTIDALCPACQAHFDAVRAAVGGLKVVVDPNLVRGLDYYTRTVFEAQALSLGGQNAVGGGGRYDALVQTLGGPDIPAVGWAVGLERLVMLLAEQGGLEAPGPELFVAVLDQAAQARAFDLVQSLRRAGLRTEMDYAPSSLKGQLRRAGKLKARRVLILGPEELARGQGTLKDMATGGQADLPLNLEAAELAERIRRGEPV